MENAIKKEIDAAKDEVIKTAEIPLEELTADISLNNLEPFIRGVLSFDLKHKRINKQFIEDKPVAAAK